MEVFHCTTLANSSAIVLKPNSIPHSLITVRCKTPRAVIVGCHCKEIHWPTWLAHHIHRDFKLQRSDLSGFCTQLSCVTGVTSNHCAAGRHRKNFQLYWSKYFWKTCTESLLLWLNGDFFRPNKLIKEFYNVQSYTWCFVCRKTPWSFSNLFSSH